VQGILPIVLQIHNFRKILTGNWPGSLIHQDDGGGRKIAGGIGVGRGEGAGEGVEIAGGIIVG
jgi:hypothetical protein